MGEPLLSLLIQTSRNSLNPKKTMFLYSFMSGVTTQRGQLIWTAPEIIRRPEGGAGITVKADVYSFAIIMWEVSSQGLW